MSLVRIPMGFQQLRIRPHIEEYNQAPLCRADAAIACGRPPLVGLPYASHLV